MALDGSLDERARFAAVHHRQEIEALHQVDGRAGRAHLAARQDHERIGEARDFGDRVADIDDRDAGFVAQPFEIGHDLLLARIVERSQRLIHEQEFRRGEQRPADCDALLFAAGKAVRVAVQQAFDAEQVRDAGEAFLAACRAGEPSAVKQILPDTQMREQAPFLENCAEPSPVGRQEDAAFRIVKDAPIDNRAPAFGPQQSGDDIDERGLARTGMPEKRDEPALGRELRIEGEIAEPLDGARLRSCRHVKAAARAARQKFRGQKSRHRDDDRDYGEPQGASVAAGNLRQRVDRRRQRLRFTGNVRDEGDGRAKFAHRPRERQDHACDDAGQDERQRNRQKHPGWTCAKGSGGGFEPCVDSLRGEPDRAHHQREPHDGAGERRARPAERKDDAEILVEERADRAFPARM